MYVTAGRQANKMSLQVCHFNFVKKGFCLFFIYNKLLN